VSKAKPRTGGKRQPSIIIDLVMPTCGGCGAVDSMLSQHSEHEDGIKWQRARCKFCGWHAMLLWSPKSFSPDSSEQANANR